MHIQLGSLCRIRINIQFCGYDIVRLDPFPVIFLQRAKNDDPVWGMLPNPEVGCIQSLNFDTRQRRILIEHIAEQHLVTCRKDQCLAVCKTRHVHQIVLFGIGQ